jgi:choline dehydrogenase-like flavoprotein
LEDRYYSGRRPNGVYIPRFQNLTDVHPNFLRGYGYEGWSSRDGWSDHAESPDYGVEFKGQIKNPGGWTFEIMGFGEMLPRYENHVRLDANKKDKWGIPLLHITCEHSENEMNMLNDMATSAAEMLKVSGFTDIEAYVNEQHPGLCIHEMGTARMGHDPKISVLNEYNQAHEVSNLFVTDGAAMASTACQNPSLTYMALTARAVDYAVIQMKTGTL